MNSSTIIQQVLRRPVLLLITLSIQPYQAISKEIIDYSLSTRPLPIQVNP